MILQELHAANLTYHALLAELHRGATGGKSRSLPGAAGGAAISSNPVWGQRERGPWQQ